MCSGCISHSSQEHERHSMTGGYLEPEKPFDRTRSSACSTVKLGGVSSSVVMLPITPEKACAADKEIFIASVGATKLGDFVEAPAA